MKRKLIYGALLLFAIMSVAAYEIQYAPQSLPGLELRNNAGIRLNEAATSGTDYIEIAGPASVATSAIVTVPGTPLTAGSGTGVAVSLAQGITRSVYKITVGYTNFKAAAVTADVTLATLPAKTVVYGMVADVTQAFACASTCTSSTLSMTCGKTAGGNEYVLSFDADAAIATFGDGISEVGAAINATNLKDIPSMSTTTTLQCRLTSGTGNLGSGTATYLNAGSITYYVDYGILP